MPRVRLFNLNHRHAVTAGFRWQIKICDLGKLALQQGNEQLIQGHAQHRGFIWRFAGVGAVVDRIAAHGDAIDGEHRKLGHLVVVTGVVAIRALHRMLPSAGVRSIGLNMAFEHNFSARWHLQRHAQSRRDLCTSTAQQAGKLVFRQTVGHWRDSTQQGGWVCAQSHCHGKGLARIFLAMLFEIQSAAAMGQPAHDHLIAREHLLAVNA